MRRLVVLSCSCLNPKRRYIRTVLARVLRIRDPKRSILLPRQTAFRFPVVPAAVVPGAAAP